ncbi:MAG: hypothetical protein SFW62_07380 [Alphaproteobacteria bacterium]|nr:hypothetical protein [Alphaproteobacteria bacterium]
MPFFALIAALAAVPLHAAVMNQAPAAHAPEFAEVIDDLPLMPGLKLVEGQDVLFSAPQAGRIAMTEAAGPVAIDAVYAFYRRSLPPLGWKNIDKHTWEREGERLRIDTSAKEKITTVRFSVKPVS